MTTKTVSGVVYEIISPSFWQLKGYPVDISFLGDKWLLACPANEPGETLFRYFPTREEACAMISQAFIARGVIQ